MSKGLPASLYKLMMDFGETLAIIIHYNVPSVSLSNN